MRNVVRLLINDLLQDKKVCGGFCQYLLRVLFCSRKRRFVSKGVFGARSTQQTVPITSVTGMDQGKLVATYSGIHLMLNRNRVHIR